MLWARWKRFTFVELKATRLTKNRCAEFFAEMLLRATRVWFECLPASAITDARSVVGEDGGAAARGDAKEFEATFITRDSVYSISTTRSGRLTAVKVNKLSTPEGARGGWIVCYDDR